jgi:hypothetical protein
MNGADLFQAIFKKNGHPAEILRKQLRGCPCSQFAFKALQNRYNVRRELDMVPHYNSSEMRSNRLRARLKIGKGAATRDLVPQSRDGEAGASPQRAVTAEPTQAPGKRPVARRVFAERAAWLRCSSVTDRSRVLASAARTSLVTPRHSALSTKTAPFRIFRRALRGRDPTLKPGRKCECRNRPMSCRDAGVTAPDGFEVVPAIPDEARSSSSASGG